MSSPHPTPSTLPDLERRVLQHPAAADAIALTVGPPSAPTTVLYLSTDAHLPPRELRRWLTSKYPGGLMPDEIYLTSQSLRASGEPRWPALEQLRDDELRRRADFQRPGTNTEKYLAALWEDLLEIDNVGLDDDFFSLGGHSMLAVRIRRAIQRDHDVLVAAEALFTNSILRDQAHVLDTARESERCG